MQCWELARPGSNQLSDLVQVTYSPLRGQDGLRPTLLFSVSREASASLELLYSAHVGSHMHLCLHISAVFPSSLGSLTMTPRKRNSDALSNPFIMPPPR